MMENLQDFQAKLDALAKENEDYFRIIEERGVQITEMCDKLTALIEAAEKLIRLIPKQTTYNGQFLHTQEWSECERKLNKTIKEAQGE